MCGFLGGVFRRPITDDEEGAFRSAIRVLAHRGPDDEQVVRPAECNALLAFRRLSILDIAGGTQPMSNGEGQHVVFNGEIYNYRELRERLQKYGVPLRTRSDTEALLWTIAREGKDGIPDLIGMFAFALLDVKRRDLLLARDRLGIKQMYYTDTPDGFFFASEPKALLSLPWIQTAFSSHRLGAFLAFRTVPAPDTLLTGIHKLDAGQVLRLDLDSWEQTVERYWTVPKPGESRIEGKAFDRFEAAFLESVKRRLIADVPVGAFLSGGLDSSLVVAAMRRLGHPDIATFSATFPGSPDDEAAYARRVSARFGTRHFEQPTNPADFLTMLNRWVELNDDLVADASCLPLLAVSRLAREQGYIVLLSGEGADELFGGYGSYHKFVFLSALHRLLLHPRPRKTALRLLENSGLLRGQDRPRAEEYLVRGRNFMGTAALLGAEELEEFLDPALAGLAWAQPRPDGRRMVDLSAFDFVTRIPEDLLVRTDRATMGASVESRVPFLDHEIVELAFNLAPWQRAVPGVSKVLLRMLAARWGIPRQTVYHRKIGFQLPLGAWFRNELQPLWRGILQERVVPGLQYDRVAETYEAHAQRRGEYEEILWRVAALELWYRRWVLGQNPAMPIGGDIPPEGMKAAS